MEKNNYPSNKLLFYFIYIIILVGCILTFIFLMYKPYYEATLNGEFIGYYKNIEEYNEYYNKIPKELNEDGLKINRYLDEEPELKFFLVKVKYVNSFNNYALLEKQFKEEYVIYTIKINDEIKFHIKTEEEANNLVKEIKEQVKESTEIIIEELKTNDKTLTNSEEEIAIIKKEVIDKNIKVTSRGGGPRVNNPYSIYIWPTVDRTITSQYGKRWGTVHTGIDIGVPLGSNVFAVYDGEVILAGWNGPYGYQVRIQHEDGTITTYSHCSKVLVTKGQKVEQGDIIAKTGSTGNSTGPHLHFEIIIDNKFKNPLNYL